MLAAPRDAQCCQLAQPCYLFSTWRIDCELGTVLLSGEVRQNGERRWIQPMEFGCLRITGGGAAFCGYGPPVLRVLLTGLRAPLLRRWCWDVWHTHALRNIGMRLQPR